MRIISHRGLLEGPNQLLENDPDQIDFALSLGFDAEIDIRYHQNGWWLGHDSATFKIKFDFIESRIDNLYLHAKDIATLYELSRLNRRLHYFFHDKDNCTLTSLGYFWTYPDSKNTLTDHSIAVLPELVSNWNNIENCFGACTDYPYRFKQTFE